MPPSPELERKIDRAREFLNSGEAGSRREAARLAGVGESTLRARGISTPRGRGGADPLPRPGVAEHEDGSATITTEPRNTPPAPWKPTELLRAHGLDPEEWVIVRTRGNRWGDPGEPLHQLRIDAVPRVVLDIFDDEPTAAPPLVGPPEFSAGTFAFITDHHAPHYHPGMHRAICSWLAAEQPGLVVLGGDLADYATVSRHRDTRGFAQSVRECNRAVFQLLSDYVEAAPKTEFVALPGNHDDRVEHYLHDKATELWQVGPAFEEREASMSLRRLWRLDELGIRLVDGEWSTAKLPVDPAPLTARHGYLASENTASKMLTKHGRSQIQGHDHKLRFTYRTRHDPIDVRVHVSAGCCCIIDDGLGYADEPDWQNAIVVGHIWDDGDFTLAPVPYIHERLLFPDGRRFDG